MNFRHIVWFRLATISCFFIFITSMLFAMIGLGNTFVEPGNKINFQNLVNDTLNTDFITIMCGISALGSSIICSILMSISRDASKFDALDEERAKYYNARMRLERKLNDL